MNQPNHSKTLRRLRPLSVLGLLLVTPLLSPARQPVSDLRGRFDAPVAPAQQDSAEVAYWNSIKDSQNPEEFRAYLKKYPDGAFADLAKNRIKALERDADEKNAKAGGADKAKAAETGDDKSDDVDYFKVDWPTGTFHYASGRLYVTPEGLEFRDADKPKNNINIPCSDIVEVKGPGFMDAPVIVHLKTKQKSYKLQVQRSLFTSSLGEKERSSRLTQTIRDACKLNK